MAHSKRRRQPKSVSLVAGLGAISAGTISAGTAFNLASNKSDQNGVDTAIDTAKPIGSAGPSGSGPSGSANNQIEIEPNQTLNLSPKKTVMQTLGEKTEKFKTNVGTKVEQMKMKMNKKVDEIQRERNLVRHSREMNSKSTKNRSRFRDDASSYASFIRRAERGYYGYNDRYWI
jgi:hypothetical protein